MNKGHSKSFSLIIVTLCLCISFSGVVNAFVMAPHNMDSPSDGALAHKSQDQETHQHHQPNVDNHEHAMSDTCCDDDQGICSHADSACATYCSVFFTQNNSYCHPMIVTAGYKADLRLSSPLAVSLDGLFKPPR